jgi:DMSO/TMAO reductase YedYZ molybdopterin-dependent catalytic subunit
MPQLYAWKSAKYVYGVEFMLEDEPGYWEEAIISMEIPGRKRDFGMMV